MEKYIIIDINTKKALYGIGVKTLLFSSHKIALEVADQFFDHGDKYIIIEIKI